MGAGRPFAHTAKEIKEKYAKYKEWIKTQTYERPELIKSGERAGEIITVKLKRPETIISFCHFAGIETQSFYNYLNKSVGDVENDKELFDTITHIHEQIKDEMIAGAGVNVYNPNIVARITGLTEQVNVNHSGDKQSVNITIDGTKLDLTR